MKKVFHISSTLFYFIFHAVIKVCPFQKALYYKGFLIFPQFSPDLLLLLRHYLSDILSFFPLRGEQERKCRSYPKIVNFHYDIM